MSADVRGHSADTWSEYLTGRNLAAEIRERGPLPVARAVDWLLQACEAIADAHLLDPTVPGHAPGVAGQGVR